MKVLRAFLVLLHLPGAASAQERWWPERRLVVVIWERRAPRTEAGQDDYGSVQQRNREVLLSLLYDGPDPLLGEAQSSTLAIYPEGLDAPAADDGGGTDYGALRGASPSELGRVWIPAMLAPLDGAVRSLIYAAAPDRATLDREIREAITRPLTSLGAAPTDIPESMGRPDDRMTRAVSHPPLVTPYALSDAVTRANRRNDLFSHVYVVWAHAGERNYAITIPQKSIARDYGPNAAEYYRASRGLYVLERDETHSNDGELADGNVILWRVRSRTAMQQPLAPVLLDGQRAAIIEERQPTLDLSMFPEDLGRALLRAQLTGTRSATWHVRYPDRRLAPIDVAAVFARSRRVVHLDRPDQPIQLGPWIDGEIGRTSAGIALDDEVFLVARHRPRTDLPAYLAEIAILIPIELRSASAPIAVTVTAAPAWVTYSIFACVVAALAYAALRLFRRLRTRSLTVHVEWEEDGIDQFELLGPEVRRRVRCFVSLLDQTGFAPVRKRIRTVLTSDEPITELPRRPGRALQSLIGPSGGETPERELSILPSRVPVRRNAVEMLLDCAAIDYGRLAGGATLNGAHSFAVDVHHAARYRATRQHVTKRYEATVRAFHPEYSISAALHDEYVRWGFFFDPKPTESETEREQPLGHILIDNPPVASGVALAISFRPLVIAGTIRGDGGEHAVRIRLYRRTGQGGAMAWDEMTPTDSAVVGNGGRAELQAYVTFPVSTRWKTRRKWTISAKIAFEVTIAGNEAPPATRHAPIEGEWYPVNRHSFACLDLGTSATRILVQGADTLAFGYVPFPATVRGDNGEPADLPAMAYVEDRDHPALGTEAVERLLASDAKPKFFLPSIKELLLREDDDAPGILKGYVRSVMDRFYAPVVAHSGAESRAELIRPDQHGLAGDFVSVERGPRHLVVMTTPNEVSPRVLRAYETAFDGTSAFLHPILLREAEAVALELIDRTDIARGRAQRLDILALDVGAGTSDAAIVTADVSRREQPSARVIAAGGVNAAGNAMDRAIFDVLAERPNVAMERDFSRLSSYQRYQYLHACELVKRAIAVDAESVGVRFPPHETQQLGRDVLTAVERSPQYAAALRRIVDDPVRMAMGRVPHDAVVKDIGAILITGRGSLIKGVKDSLRNVSAPVRAEGAVLLDSDGHSGRLKAAVSLGARSFARRYWSSLTLTGDVFGDRIFVIGYHHDGVDLRLLVESGTRYRNGVIHAELVLPWDRWRSAIVVRTFLRSDDRYGPELLLGPEKCAQIAAGMPIEPFSVRPYTVLADLPRPRRHKERTWYAVVRIDHSETVHVVEEPR